MGIKGMWEMIKEKGKEIEEEEIKGKRVAIDISEIIIRCMKKKEDVNTMMMKIIIKSKEKGIYPIFVFDGKTQTYLKENTIKKRIKRYNKEEERKKEIEKKEINKLITSIQKRKKEHIENNNTNNNNNEEELLLLIKKDKQDEYKLTPNISLIQNINSNLNSIKRIYSDSLLDSSSSPFLFTHTQINHRIIHGFYNRYSYSINSPHHSSLLSSDLSLWGLGALSFSLYSSLINSFLSSLSSIPLSDSSIPPFLSSIDSFESIDSIGSTSSPLSISPYQSILSSHTTLPNTANSINYDYDCYNNCGYNYDDYNDCDDYDDEKIKHDDYDDEKRRKENRRNENTRREDGTDEITSFLPLIPQLDKDTTTTDWINNSTSIQPSYCFQQNINNDRNYNINNDIEKERNKTKENKEERTNKQIDTKEVKIEEINKIKIEEINKEKQEEEIIQEIEEIINRMKEEKKEKQKCCINIKEETKQEEHISKEETNNQMKEKEEIYEIINKDHINDINKDDINDINKEKEEEEIKEIINIKEEEIKEINNKEKKEKENFNCISNGIIKNQVIYQKLIKMFKEINIPYIIAPGEAEAQCYQLEHDGLCDYIATNDSDIFVYGAKNVIKNLFTSSHPLLYSSSTFDYSLDQIRLYSLLVPSDYSNGIPNIGPISAKKIINSFHTINDFLNPSLLSSPPPHLSSILSSLHLPPHFPNPLILSQFSSPNVLLSPSLPISPLPSLSSLFLYSKHSLHWSSSLLLRYFPSFC
ncbi:hypothetical protein, conserved [Entamoeba dispar SAW760]|uniref:Uncharacterized protein n=1 Tax=Entamoeba dispar (strain ATCC PRA-260 / SAW760) TaxID=370354 RepID=B0E8J6_ENTDS|nr:uncharacterized protein EDI_127020 [Entamoeba dispar SAW760]EDR29139.1 hypothetical protein, conserved [Entamoeba dispar SAW760]|eukprot:EDR29139.1 hypothetical protein, conserved [Entamoeba dispar SAW760]